MDNILISIPCPRKDYTAKSDQATHDQAAQDPLHDLLKKALGYPREGFADLHKPQRFLYREAKHVDGTTIGATYWIPKHLMTKQLKEDLEPLPFGQFIPLQCFYEHITKKDLYGIPRFLGLSLFGPSRDIRSEGKPFCDLKEYDFQLRPIQTRAVQQTLETLKVWGGATIIADCGFGKTRVAIDLIAKLGRRALILCNREVLMDQWASVVRDLCPEWRISWLKGRANMNKKIIRCESQSYCGPLEDSEVCIASIETIIEDVCTSEWYKTFGTVIVDECHHIAAPSLLHALPLIPAKNIIGLSATPNRSDGFEYILYWILGPTSFVYARTPEVTGLRDTVEVRKILFTAGQQFEKAYFNGQLAYAEMTTALTEDAARNEVLIDLIMQSLFGSNHSARKKIIVVSSLVKHCDFLCESIKEKAPHIKVARMAGPNIETALAKDPETRIVFATYSMLEEGYDDPVLDTLVLCTPRSRIQQTIGRIERSMQGKMRPLVLDIVDDFSIYPSMWYKRRKFYTSRGFMFTDCSQIVHS